MIHANALPAGKASTMIPAKTQISERWARAKTHSGVLISPQTGTPDLTESFIYLATNKDAPRTLNESGAAASHYLCEECAAGRSVAKATLAIQAGLLTRGVIRRPPHHLPTLAR